MSLPRLAQRCTRTIATQQQAQPHRQRCSHLARTIYNTKPSSSSATTFQRVAPLSTSSRLDAKPPPDPTPNPTETSKSGGGDAGAAHTDAAFDPKTTDPEQEEASSSSKNKSKDDPLKVSPADKDANTKKDARAEGAVDANKSKR